MNKGLTRRSYRGAHRYECSIHGFADLPGATTIMRMQAAEGLEVWKRDQLLRIVFDRLANIRVMLDGDGLDVTLAHFHELSKRAGTDARDIGIEVHAAVEAIVKGREPVITPRIEGHVEGFRKWMTDNKPVIRQSEYMVVSETHGYGATGDLAFTMDGEYWGVDVKTGKVLPETGMQLAAIRFADHAGRPGDEIAYPVPQTTRHGVLAVHEDETTLKPYYIKPNREWEGFLHCLGLYKYKRAKAEVFTA